MSRNESGKSFFHNHGEALGPQIRVDRDELSEPTDPDGGRAAIAEGPSGNPGQRGWPKGRSRRGQQRKTKLAVLGIPSGVLAVGNQDYARCVRLASSYRKCRVRELATSHGYVSSGASALLASAALAIASSRYLYEQAAQAGDQMLEVLKTASRLADSARQNELAAYELCARESLAKRKSHMAEAGLPWLVPLEDQRKPGPKKKAPELPAVNLPPIGADLTSWIQDAIVVSKDGADEPRAGSGTSEEDGGGQAGSRR